jgi:protein-disulfide isomerase
MSARGLAIAVMLAVSAVSPAVAGQPAVGFDGRAIYRVDAEGGPSIGPATAPVTIVEFSDFLCGYCQRAAETIAELRLLYGEQIRVVYRHSLLDGVDGTLPAEAALAAEGQGRFWAFHDRVYAGERAPSRATLEAYAGEVGLDLPRFRRELEAGTHRSALRAQLAAAAALGVSSTPMFFVNGRPLSGAQPIGVFTRVIDEELGRAARAQAGGVAPAALYRELTRDGQTAAGALGPDAVEIGAEALDPARRYPAGLGLPVQRRGSDDALVTIVEFGDFLCGYCAKVQPTLAAMRAKYGADLRIVVRFLPLGGNPGGRQLAHAVLAAGEQGKFWQLHDALFAAGRLDGATAARAIAGLGLDTARFRAALADGRHRRVVTVDEAEGSRFGVRGTPTFFINGRVLVGAQPAAAFEEAIEAELARARALLRAGVPRADIYRRASEAAP